MTRPSNVHYDPDGSIDFDYYRRRAVRQRRLVMRIVLRRALGRFGRILRSIISVVSKYPAASRRSHDQSERAERPLFRF